ncbi:MAG: hypothetical protein AB1673_06740 [Actinomycetota bacterium]
MVRSNGEIDILQRHVDGAGGDDVEAESSRSAGALRAGHQPHAGAGHHGPVVVAYRRLLEVERRFRVLKDFLHLRPVYHWTEDRVRGHIAICVYAAVIESLMAADLRAADVRDPDLDDQHLSPARAMRELARVHAVVLDAGGRCIELMTRRSALQADIDAFGGRGAGPASRRSRSTGPCSDKHPRSRPADQHVRDHRVKVESRDSSRARS